jgi:hypothetical protein
MRLRVSLGSALLGALVLACGAPKVEDGGATPVLRHPVTLRVLNYNFLQARIFVRGGGYRQRLGEVESGGDRTFEFSWPYADVQVEIDLISVPSTFTEPMPVLPGDTLQLEIQQSPGIAPIVRRVR